MQCKTLVTKYSRIPDEEYINRAIVKYRKRYPNDYYMTDEDLGQELKIKMFINRRKGRPRTSEFDTYLNTIHNMNKSKFPDNIELLDFDDVKDEVMNTSIEEGINKVDNYIYLVDILKYCMENTLTRRECNILKFRYGMLPDSVYDDINAEPITSKINKFKYSLADASRYFGVTGERIRQIEVRAFKKLRHPSNFK